MKIGRCGLLMIVVIGFAARCPAAARDDDLRFWVENMVWYHNYTLEEMREATNLSREEIQRAIRKFGISPESRPKRQPTDPLLVLPYPGGRHPRIGFLDGAVNPMRGTKFSAFLPWPDSGYVVVDLPEAIWCGSDLLFLAHTHIPTVWDKKGQPLQNVDWDRKEGGVLEETRTLPNGIVIGARVSPRRDVVDMELWIKNGTETPLSKLRSQVCVMLKGASDFNAQTNDNKVLTQNVAAARSGDGRRWIAAVWERGRTWANPPVPCIHSDPQFPDCPPGATVSARGCLFFWVGENINTEIERLKREGRLSW